MCPSPLQLPRCTSHGQDQDHEEREGHEVHEGQQHHEDNEGPEGHCHEEDHENHEGGPSQEGHRDLRSAMPDKAMHQLGMAVEAIGVPIQVHPMQAPMGQEFGAWFAPEKGHS